MMKIAVSLIFCIVCLCLSAAETYDVCGRVIDRDSRLPVGNAAVTLLEMPSKSAITDSAGTFCLRAVAPGIYKLAVTCTGYKNTISPEYIISPQMPLIEIELDPKVTRLGEITVQSSTLRRLKASPVSLQVIGLREIEKSPGGNRDISRIIRSYPGVAFSVGGYRNDLIVRGGAPSENRFYLDGVEIPNINHFATQGASGGAVSILNADMIREVQFYSGAFPIDKSGAMSSVMDIRLRNGNMDKHSFKATLGASEVAVSGTGHIKENTSYLFSLRQSYLQLLFKALGLPFLPNFIDAQLKVRTRLTPHNELTFIGLAGIDDMKLNKDKKGDDAEYILSYLPHIKQQTFTLGTVYKHYAEHSVGSVILGYNFLRNQNVKYHDNDETSAANKTLDVNSSEQKLSLKAENAINGDAFTLLFGAEGAYSHYFSDTYQRLFADTAYVTSYRARLGILGWGAYASAKYRLAEERVTLMAAMRIDGCGYSALMSRFWKQFSPRFSAAYRFLPEWSLNAAAGIYYQLPPYTALGYMDSQGNLLNADLRYFRVKSANLGVEYNRSERLVASVEAFYKRYDHAALSVVDGIPLASKGADYGVVGNERLIPSAQGRAYGAEASLRWQVPSRFNLVSSLTFYRCEYRNAGGGDYIPSAWDNRFIANLLGTYFLGEKWNFGAKLSAIGGAPYTPYDVAKSSLVKAWNVRGRPYYDYSRYNKERLKAYAQLDVRIDRMFYFHRWMLGLYLDIQNLTKSCFRDQDALMSTGIIENPHDTPEQQRYVMKYIKQRTATLLPTIGVTVGF